MRSPNRPHARRQAPAGGGLSALGFFKLLPLVLIGLLFPWFGCSPERNYEVLSFFFDGVPDPNAPVVSGEVDEQGNPVVRAVSFSHKPYEENKCDACHETATGRFDDFNKLDNSICMKCHEGVPVEYPRMHGPVALGECNLCHVPHESSVRPLLKEAAPAVCMSCHVRELLPSEPPDHQTDRNCLDCHSGHGGSARGLLLAGWTSTTQPTPPAANQTPRPAAREVEP